MEIQLVIRAPNQNIADQVINCNTDWTIRHLKKHLSDVYPSRPIVQDQKLIYSGRLLLDHLQLKNIIRQEDMQSSVHIFHLVCRGNNYSSFIQTPSTSQEGPSLTSPVQPSRNNENPGRATENTLRRRRNSPAPTVMNNIPLQFQQMPVNNFVPIPENPEIMAQMAIMQQMYAQYLAQYWQSMNMTGITGNHPFNPIAPNFPTLQNNPNNENPPQQHGNHRNNAPPMQPMDDNEYANRDWLDHVFLYFRFLILLCIVYFYTTPERFMIVILLVVIAFLYHEGWFVRQGIVDAMNGGPQIRGEVEPIPNNAINENEGLDGHELEEVMDGEDPLHGQNVDAANNNDANIFSPITFLTTFFSSLIPEPPPPVNIN